MAIELDAHLHYNFLSEKQGSVGRALHKHQNALAILAVAAVNIIAWQQTPTTPIRMRRQILAYQHLTLVRPPHAGHQTTAALLDRLEIKVHALKEDGYQIRMIECVTGQYDCRTERCTRVVVRCQCMGLLPSDQPRVNRRADVGESTTIHFDVVLQLADHVVATVR